MDAAAPRFDAAKDILNNKTAELPSGRKLNADPKALRASAEEFEAVFVSQMLTHMFESVEIDPLTGGGNGEEVFRSLLVNEYGKSIAKRGGLGIADHVQREMLRMQEGKGK